MEETSVRIRLLLVVIAGLLLTAVAYLFGDDTPFFEAVGLVARDPARLAGWYLICVGLIASTLLVFGPRGLWWSLIDAVCATGTLCLGLSPLLGWAAGSFWTALALAATGALTLAGCIALYRWGKDRPVIRLFPRDDEQEDDKENEAPPE